MRIPAALVLPIPPLTGDAVQYDQLGVSLADGRGFTYHDQPTAIRPPVYPVFLSVIYGVAGHSLRAARVTQGLVDVVTVALVFAMARRFAGETVAWIGTFMAATSPALVFSSTQFLSETIYTLILTASMYLLVSSQTTLDVRRALGAGVLFGLGALGRAVALPLLLVIAAGGLLRSRRQARLVAAAVLAALITIVPWTARNWSQLGLFVPVSNSRAGMTLWLGSYEPWGLSWRGWSQPPLDRILSGLDPDTDSERVDRRLLVEAFRNIQTNPAGYVKLSLQKAWLLWHPPQVPLGSTPAATALETAFQAYHFTVLALFGIGLWRGRMIRDARFWVVMLVAYWTAVHVVTMATGRYLVPLTPFICVVSASGIVALRHMVDSKPLTTQTLFRSSAH